MSLEKITDNNSAELMAHIAIIGGILVTLPDEQVNSVKTYALALFDRHLEKENAKETPNALSISLLEDAKTKTINLFPTK